MHKKFVLIALSVIITFTSSFCNPEQTGNITKLYVHNRDDGTTDVVIIELDGTFNKDGSTCATQDQWLIDLNDPSGKVQYATVLAAQAQDRPIRLQGQPLNQCDVLSGYMVVRNVYLVW